MLHTGITWEHLPQELGFGSGTTCWRRLAEWTEARVWPRLHGAVEVSIWVPNAVGADRPSFEAITSAIGTAAEEGFEQVRRLAGQVGAAVGAVAAVLG